MLALFVALALQIGVNYANDYSDGIRGTDDQRVGPMRLVGSRVAPPRQVLAAALGCFAAAAVLGLVLVVATQAGGCCWWARRRSPPAWFYTGGERPTATARWARWPVFVFFGLVARGRHRVRADRGRCRGPALVAAVPVGLLSCSMLVVNNLRDIGTDGQVGQADAGGRARRAAHPYPLRGLPDRAVRGRARHGRWPRPLAALAVLAAPLAISPVQDGAARRGRAPR